MGIRRPRRLSPSCVCVCVCVWTSNHRQTGGTRRRQTTARDSIAARRGRVTSSSVERARSHCHAPSCLRFTCFKGGLAAVPIVPWPVATGAPVWTHLGIGGSVLAYSRCNALPHILYKARLTSVGFRSRSRFLAVSLQVM